MIRKIIYVVALASLVAGGAAGELTVDAVLSSAELGAPLFETGGAAPPTIKRL